MDERIYVFAKSPLQTVSCHGEYVLPNDSDIALVYGEPSFYQFVISWSHYFTQLGSMLIHQAIFRTKTPFQMTGALHF